jgi:cysteine desulfurase
VTVLPVDGRGFVEPDAVENAIGPRTALVSVMAANNEIGVLQPIAEIGRRCRERGVPFHSDAAQALGRVALDVEADAIDLLSFTAHKVYGPKGVGALYVREARPRLRLEPLVHGGGHERGLRSGTVPVALAVGFARAVELALETRESEAVRQAALRERLWGRLRNGLEGLVRSGDPAGGLPNNLHVCVEGVEADAVLASLPDVALSSGSACSSAQPEPSHVLAALGLPPALARGALRFGLGRGTTTQEIDRAADRVIEVVRGLRAARSGLARSADAVS